MSVNKPLMNAFLFLLSAIFALLGCELAVRLVTGDFEWRNYAASSPRSVRMIGSVKFDAEIGYVPIPNRMDIGFGPIGNRINYPTSPNDPVPALPERPIIAFGDSFTYGSEVGPNESWPAQLEQSLGVPVVNAGVGGYGIDQMVLFAERIVPAVKPRMILLSFIPNDVERVRASIFSGVAKPYFTVENEKLSLRNVPLSPPEASENVRWSVRPTLGYSLLVSFVTDRLGFGSWWRAERPMFKLEKVDAVKVSCLLMGRMKRLSDKMAVPVVVIAQNGWSDFTPNGKSARDQQVSVLDCARQSGMMVIDTFDEVYHGQKADGREAYYVNGEGHMTAKGNAVIARRVTEGLRRFAGQL